jgi:hypothetical protein
LAYGLVIEANDTVEADLAAAGTVEVIERMGQTTRFNLRISADIAGGDIPALLDARLDPGNSLSIFVDDGGGGVACLARGELDSQDIVLIHGGEGSLLVAGGGDATLAMDREVKVSVWEGAAMTDASIVTSIVGEYGLTPMVAPTLATRPASRHPAVQRGTDLAFVRRLARRNGCLFWVRPMAAAAGPVIENAHFAPPEFQDGDLAELILNRRDGANIDRLDISFDVSGPTSVVSDQVDLTTARAFDGDSDMGFLDPLGQTAIDAIGPSPRSHRLTAACDQASELAPRSEAVLSESQFFLRARAATTVQRLGRLVRAHETVRLTGAGSRHSGRYYVSAVRHRIDEVAHAMDIELVRNAWGEEPGGLGGLL